MEVFGADLPLRISTDLNCPNSEEPNEDGDWEIEKNGMVAGFASTTELLTCQQ